MPDDFYEYLARRSSGIKVNPPKQDSDSVLDNDTEEDGSYDFE